MSEPARETRPVGKWLGIAILVLLVIGGAFWFARPAGEPAKVAPAEPVAQSTEWTEEPEGPAVPVTLPTTPLMNVPIEDRSESRGAEKEAE